MWLYLPEAALSATARSKVLRCAQDLEAWSSACISRSPAIELFALSSEKLTPRPPSWPGWRTRRWITRLSGATLAPSTANRGAAGWISSLPDTHASRSPRAGCGKAPRTRGTCGRKLSASSPRACRHGSSARTSRDISIWDFPTSGKDYKPWASRLRRACSRRMKLERQCRGVVSSYWPTPTARMSGNRGDIRIDARRFAIIPRGDQIGKQIGLKEAARTWTALWHLAETMGFEPVRARPTYPYSHPLHVTCRPGTHYSHGDLILNPSFGEMVMGWPIGWSAAASKVTGFARWLQRSRGELSKLISKFEPEPEA